MSIDPKNCGAVGVTCSGSVDQACCSQGICGAWVGSGPTRVCRQGLPITVIVSPQIAEVPAGAQLQLSSLVQNSADSDVAWMVNGQYGGSTASGTIDYWGLYTAPGQVPNPATIEVRAVSYADPTRSAGAMVTVTAPVTVDLAPATATVLTGSTSQFQASVGNASDTSVTWSVHGIPGGNAVVGTITSAGLYSAPTAVPTPTTVVLSARSNADPARIATALVTVGLPLPSVSVSPASVQVVPGSTKQFAVRVQNSVATGVLWKVNQFAGGNGTYGTISTSGLYTAPAAVPTPAEVTVSAVSTADGTTTGSASALVVAPIVTVTVSPATVSMQVGKSQQFTATVQGSATTSVKWKVNGLDGGNATVGTVTTAGLYKAPTGVPAQAVTVSAVSVADPSRSGTASVTLGTSTAVLVSVNPVSATVGVGLTQQYTATVQNTTNTKVTWKVNGTSGGSAASGTITTAGLYKAPSAVPGQPTVTVAAFSAADTTKSGSASATVYKPISVSVSPTSSTLATGQDRQFTATVQNAANAAVTWQVNGVTGGDSTVGLISPSGLFTAPSTTPSPAVVKITATSSADPSKNAAANVTLTTAALAVAVTPATALVNAGEAIQFVAQVSNSSSTSVRWTVNGIEGGSASLGQIGSTGTYTAPAIVPSPATVTIAAVSSADASKSGKATVTIALPNRSITLSPPYAGVQEGHSLQFTASVRNVPGAALRWAVNGVEGGTSSDGTVTPSGLYTAPAALPPNQVVVSASLGTDAMVVGSATIAVTGAQPVEVTVSPDPWFMVSCSGVDFHAFVTNTSDTNVTWAVNGVVGGLPGLGNITQEGAIGMYMAPCGLKQPMSVTVSAVSNADRTKVASAKVNITNLPPVGVFVGPTGASVPAGEFLRFEAEVHGPPSVSKAVYWLVNGLYGGDTAHGTIDQAGGYRAPVVVPADPIVVSVQLVANHEVMASTGVTVTPSSYVVVHAPPSVKVGTTVSLGASVLNPTNQSVTWAVNGVFGGTAESGTIDAAGYYTAPAAVPSVDMVTITATSNADPTKSGSATIRITLQDEVVIYFPATVRLVAVGESIQLKAVVLNTADTSVTWRVNGLPGGDATVGTIDAGGWYRAPSAVPVPSTVVISAMSNADPTKSAVMSLTVTVRPPISIEVGPICTITARVNQRFQFTGSVQDSENLAVLWQVYGHAPGDPEHGSITNGGLFTAPGSVPANPIVPIIGVSKADPTVWNVNYVRILP